MHRIYLISRSPCQTPFGRLEFGRVRLSRLRSGPAVLWGQGEAAGAGQGSVVQSGIVLENRAGSAGIQLPSSLVPRPPPVRGMVYRQSVSRHRAGGPAQPFPFNLLPFSFPLS